MLNKLTQKAFWKKFLRYFSVGLSIVLLIAFISSLSLSEITQRGPKNALAQQIGDCDNGQEYLGSYIGWQWTGCTSGGYEAPSQVPGQVPSQVPSQVPTQLPPKQPEQPRYCPNQLEPAYPQCGKDIIAAGTTVNDAGQGINPTSVYLVTKYTNSCNTSEVRGYAVSGSQKDNAPECGYITPAQPAPQPIYQPQPQPQPAPQPIYQPVVQPQAPICLPQNVSMSVNPNPVQSGGTVNLNVSGSEGSTWIDDKIVDQNGNTIYQGGFWGGKVVGPLNAGSYTWTHYYRNTAPNNVNITSDLCQKPVTFTVNQPAPVPTPTPTPVAQVSCPAVSFSIPSGIQPNQNLPVTVNTSGGQNWNNITLYMDGQRVSGGGQNGSSFTWNVNSGNAGSSHNLEFKVNDGPVYGTNQTPLSCGVTSFATQAPTPKGAPELKCPEGTVQTLEGNTIVCIQNINTVNNVNNINNQNTQSQSQVVNVPAPQVITVPQAVQTVSKEVYIATPAAQPKVVTVAASEVQALPKTGLPLAGVALGGLLPIGMRLRRIGKSKDILSANSIWEQRQFQI